MASRYEREDSDVNIAVISNDDHPMTNNFEVEEPPLLSSAPGPWWHKMSANPADWYKGAVKEAKDFSWEITEPNHVVSFTIINDLAITSNLWRRSLYLSISLHCRSYSS